ncbi:MAG: hypothetical protein H8E26_10245 [FCB group bacterium]|nr:hypothetical protein [FCB group bacterium]MBL7120961.1 hypothetical protein [Candidatus Neomarinimicrobiota bacterium]
MYRTSSIAIMLTFVLGLAGPSRLLAQSLTIYYGNNKTLQDCQVVSVSEFNVSVEYVPFLPGVYTRTNLSLAEITGIREFSRANRYTPCLMVLGSYLGVRFFFKERGSIEEMTLSERFATFLDTPLNFITTISVGGAVGYLTGHYLLGGNHELIALNELSNAEKQSILAAYMDVP